MTHQPKTNPGGVVSDEGNFRLQLDDPRMPKLFEDLHKRMIEIIRSRGLFFLLQHENMFTFVYRNGMLESCESSRMGFAPSDIHPSAQIDDTASIARGVVIGSNCVVGPYAVIRAGTWLWPGCHVGPYCEIKNSIFLPGARASHHNYVGDSILGRDVNLGAGVKLANFRHDGQPISIKALLDTDTKIETGSRKFGSVLGDGVQVGCNSVLYPGTIIGAGAMVDPMTPMRSGVYEGGRRYFVERQVMARDL